MSFFSRSFFFLHILDLSHFGIYAWVMCFSIFITYFPNLSKSLTLSESSLSPASECRVPSARRDLTLFSPSSGLAFQDPNQTPPPLESQPFCSQPWLIFPGFGGIGAYSPLDAVKERILASAYTLWAGTVSSLSHLPRISGDAGARSALVDFRR